MRILHIGSGNLYGGVEVLLVTLARLHGYCPRMTQEFALCFPGRAHDELAVTGVATHLLGAARLSRPWTVWRCRRRLRDLLKQIRYDAVICHGSWSLALFAPVIRNAGVALVMWLHDAPGQRLHWLERLAQRHSPDRTIANSDYTLATLPRLFPRGQGERIYCPVEFTKREITAQTRAATRAAYGADAQSVVLLQVGRWDPYKGHLLFMEALSQLAHVPGWVCWQAGGVNSPGEERYFQIVQEAARRHGLEDRIRFLGFLSNQTELPRVLAAADVYCQPNVHAEPFGITFIEAMMARLPVVGTSLGGPKEIVDESCGILVAPDDAPALAGALASLIGNRELRERLGRGGPERARGVSDPADRIEQLANLFAALLAPMPTAEESLCKR
jgi:glycosyltransferase involved in cell wall biosynthesis